MDRRIRIDPHRLRALLAAAWIVCPWAVQAQSAATSTAAGAEITTLQQAFEAAWARQPEALALQARRDAVQAQQSAARAWTPEPAALALSSRTDRLNRNRGAREHELAVAVPIWLPGERSRSVALADAESSAVESRRSAAQLRVAAAVRDAWWHWQRARIDLALARDQLDSTGRVAADVARRTQAGEMARADQHQADGAVAAAELSLARAEAGLASARQQLRALAGREPAAGQASSAAEERPPAAAAGEVDAHAALHELRDRAALAEAAAELAAARSRANPELTLATTRDRGAYGEAAQQSVTLGVRIPFGGGPRHDARRALARAEAIDVRAQLDLERERLVAEREAARLRLDAASAQLAAAERRALLARESRGFFEKSFRLGETDLPTRLRVDAEATEAERQAALSRIELAAAISAWRQALGLLPK